MKKNQNINMSNENILDIEELKYPLDLSETNSDFEETQELKYFVDLSFDNSENTDS